LCVRRAKYLYWLFFAPSCVEPAIIQIFTKVQVPASTAGWGEATQVFDVLDKALEKGPWLLGDDFSAADIAIGAGLNSAVRLFKMVPSRPSFDRYLDRCAARPAFQRATTLAA
jgi:glutathione S-transferase